MLSKSYNNHQTDESATETKSFQDHWAKTLHQCMSIKATSSIPQLCIIQLFNQKWRIHCYNQWLNMLLEKVFKFKLCTKPHLAALTTTHQTSHQSSPDTCLELASAVVIYFQTRLCMLKLSNHSKNLQPQIKHRDRSHKLSASKKPQKHQDLHRFCSGYTNQSSNLKLSFKGHHQSHECSMAFKPTITLYTLNNFH